MPGGPTMHIQPIVLLLNSNLPGQFYHIFVRQCGGLVVYQVIHRQVIGQYQGAIVGSEGFLRHL